MYSETVIFALLATGTFGFPASGTTELPGGNDSGENTDAVLSEPKTLLYFEAISGNPHKLTENSTELAAKTRRVRCVAVGLFAACEEGVDPAITAAHIERTQGALFKFMEKSQDQYIGLISTLAQSRGGSRRGQGRASSNEIEP